jgi:K+-transporting ATPase ATPase C chain
VFSVGVSSILFNQHSNGSIITKNGKIVGSRLIGQEFTSNNHLHSRPSANNYKNNFSGNSNYAYKSEDLRTYIKNKYNNFKTINNNSGDLNILSESASGLDPHITYEGATAQIKRISSSSKISENEVRGLIDKHAKPRIIGLFGEKIINVVELNLDLNKLSNKDAKKT